MKHKKIWSTTTTASHSPMHNKNRIQNCHMIPLFHGCQKFNTRCSRFYLCKSQPTSHPAGEKPKFSKKNTEWRWNNNNQEKHQATRSSTNWKKREKYELHKSELHTPQTLEIFFLNKPTKPEEIVKSWSSKREKKEFAQNSKNLVLDSGNHFTVWQRTQERKAGFTSTFSSLQIAESSFYSSSNVQGDCVFTVVIPAKSLPPHRTCPSASYGTRHQLHPFLLV